MVSYTKGQTSMKPPNEGEIVKQFMRKTFVASATAIVLSSGATAALAEDASTTSTTVPATTATKTISAERTAYRLALQAYNKAKVEINKNFATAMRDANSARRTARESATTKEAKKAAQTAFSSAITAAQNARTAALAALGDPPVKPVKAPATNS